MTFINEDAILAVKRGASWMDDNFPGWASRIDLTQLDMFECDQCIIGQGAMNLGYWYTIEQGSRDSGLRPVAWAMEHGFDADGDLGGVAEARYSELEVLWTDEVKKRLG